jgi:predicted RNA methylase
MNRLGLILVLIGIIIIMYFFWPLLKGAPWVPSRMKKVRRMLSLADFQPGEVFYDLGCGDGRVIITAARKFSVNAVGIEINIFLYLWCQLVVTILGLRKKVKIVYGNFFKRDLSDADVVMCYLLPETNDKLENKLLRELKPTTRVISNSFVFNKLPVVFEDVEKGIYIYKILEEIQF